MLEVQVRQLGKLKPRGIKRGAQSLLDSGSPGSVPTALDSWTSAPPMCHTALGCSAPLDPDCGWRGLARKSQLARASTNSCPPVLSAIQCKVVGRNFRLSYPTLQLWEAATGTDNAFVWIRKAQHSSGWEKPHARAWEQCRGSMSALLCFCPEALVQSPTHATIQNNSISLWRSLLSSSVKWEQHRW